MSDNVVIPSGSPAQQLRAAAPSSSNRDEARRIAEEIKQMIVDADTRVLDGYMWGFHDFEHLRDLVAGNEVDALKTVQRVLLPLQREFAPGFIGAMVKNIKRMGVENAGDLVTRESVAGWTSMVDAINEYGQSMGNPDIVIDHMAQEVFLLAFTDPDIAAGEIISVVDERGLVSADTMRGVIAQRRVSIDALREGVL